MKKHFLIVACCLGLMACSNDSANKVEENEETNIENNAVEENTEPEEVNVISLKDIEPFGKIYECPGCEMDEELYFQIGLNESENEIEAVWLLVYDYFDTFLDRLVYEVTNQENLGGGNWKGKMLQADNNDAEIIEFEVKGNKLTITHPDPDPYATVVTEYTLKK